MAPMFTLEDLLDRLDAARERTLVALEALPDEALTQPGVVGRWAIADLLSILTAWDAEVVTGPVSYTHLDVYKRQVFSRSVGQWGSRSVGQ